jgi:hypothetical protein
MVVSHLRPLQNRISAAVRGEGSSIMSSREPQQQPQKLDTLQQLLTTEAGDYCGDAIQLLNSFANQLSRELRYGCDRAHLLCLLLGISICFALFTFKLDRTSSSSKLLTISYTRLLIA